ncbi:unnamed protein product [Prunus armeniaca]
MERSYLVAFLAYWLCKFVFSKNNVTFIRPGVFKVARRISHGVSFSLAVPVLASIYKRQNDISSADDLGNCTTVLPLHYVYGWLGKYFDTHFTSSFTKSIPIMAMFSGRIFGKVEMSLLARMKTTESSNLIASTGLVDSSTIASTITLPAKDNIREFEVHHFESTKSKTVSTVGKSSSLSQPKSFKS